MYIDYRIADGPRGGLTFDFIPCHHAIGDKYDYDRSGPDVFNVKEEAFLFIEGIVARSIPDWTTNCHHWGVTWIGRETWLDILSRFPDLRRDVLGNVRLTTIVSKYVICPGLLPRRHELHRKALLDFLDRFEDRVHAVVKQYPCLLIGGI
jgi:hypothetical protein